jgi:hypothetical protein
MRTTVNPPDDAAIAARNAALGEHVSLAGSITVSVRHVTSAVADANARPGQDALRGRFALLPVHDEVVTPQHVRELMEREGI